MAICEVCMSFKLKRSAEDPQYSPSLLREDAHMADI